VALGNEIKMKEKREIFSIKMRRNIESFLRRSTMKFNENVAAVYPNATQT
jgi:hypothetical protein